MENNYINRISTKKVKVGGIFIGGDSPITVQSMTNTFTKDIASTVRQIKELEDVGCDIVRVAVPDLDSAYAIKNIKKLIKLPIVADIHFDYRLAIESIKSGADKIRINPGNIGDFERVKTVVNTAKEHGIPIRIGVNSGSLEEKLFQKFGGVTPEAMVESALGHLDVFLGLNFDNIVFSLKASSVAMTIAAYRLMAKKTEYPLHIGVTEAGTVYKGTVRSSVGLGCLLAEGIGDTLRVSLTGEPKEEVRAGIEILKSLNLRQGGVRLVSCPTCGRCQINLISIANAIEEKLENVDKNITVAVMGCSVNGPGEAKEADIGIAGGKGEALLFKKGEIIRKIPQECVIEELLREIAETF